MQEVLILEVVSPQAATMGPNRRKSLTRAGGTIGRHESNAWVIPDKFISSQHATIRFLSGLYWIEALGRNPTAINDRANVLKNNQPHPLSDGDRLFLDEYEITVRIGDEQSVEEAGVDLLADEPVAYGDTTPQNAGAWNDAGLASDHPLLDSSSQASADVDILDLFPGGDAVPAAGSAPSAAFAPTPLEQRPVQLETLRTPPQEAGAGLSEFFGEHSSAQAGEPLSQPIVPRAVDLSDDWFSDNQPVTPPLEPAFAPSRPPTASSPPPVAVPTPGRVPGSSTSARPHVATAGMAVSAAASPVGEAPSRQAVAGASLGDLLRGAGLSVEDEQISPEVAAQFGEALRIVIAGVMELLQARSAIKDQFRMRQTRFSPAGNNPLKLASNVEDALHTLLVKRDPRFGYLSTTAAFEDAFDDLRHHQYAMLEGIKIATRALLSRFDPAALGEEFERKAGRGGLLGMSSKNRYWDLYVDRFAELTRDPDESFRRLFGDDFGEAYEEQLNALKDAQRRQPPPGHDR